MSRFAELATATNFSFLRGASHPEEMVAQAMALGHIGIGVADRNSLAGVVRAHSYLREHAAEASGFRLAIGARLVFADETPDVLCYPKDRAAYGRLCRLLTRGNMRAQKGECRLFLDDLLEFSEGQQLIVMEGAAPPLALLEAARGRLWLAATALYGVDMRSALARRIALSREMGLPLIAVNEANMHVPERRPLADVLACVREKTTLDNAGYLLSANAERSLKSGAEMARLFVQAPQAVEETARFLEGLSFRLDALAHNYPSELREGFASEQEALEYYAREGARMRYPNGVPDKVETLLRHELKLIAELGYAAYFLTVHDIVRFARAKDILAQGRGSAANSVICFCLGVTEVDPTKHDLLFERFVSAARNEPPDIDVDFEHERREEVMQYIYARYGRERAGLTATVVSYRSRSAIREVGKAFGLSADVVSRLSNNVWGGMAQGEASPPPPRGGRSSAEGDREGVKPRVFAVEPHPVRLSPADPPLKGEGEREPRLAKALELTRELTGFPRHLSQHTGGFVITRDRLDEIVPLAPAAMEGRTTIEWDKDDLDALRILKIDVLALGMLTCLRKGLALLAERYDVVHRLSSIPAEEESVYDMISRADTIGVFQIESRAQMSMLPRLRPREFYDLVIEVAIVRPGPIQGDMVHPYLRRRIGKEQVSFPSAELEQVLRKTLGVPLFQEQAMRIAIVAGGFTPDEADRLRRAMATFKRVGTIGTFRAKMLAGMEARGYSREFAERCWGQIEGFGSYGFPESHAASFALLVYASAWLKCRYPDVFCCALLNAQPMGFYAPAQIVRDAQEHGVGVHEVDVNASDWDCTLETRAQATPLHSRHASMAGDIRATHDVRLGFRQIVGLREADMKRLVAKRGAGYDSVRDLWLRGGLEPSTLERLAEAGAFASLGLPRRDALWAVQALNRAGDKDDLPLLRALSFAPQEEDANLPPMPLGAEVVEDYRFLSLSLKAHPMAFLRARLEAKGIMPCGALGGGPLPHPPPKGPLPNPPPQAGEGAGSTLHRDFAQRRPLPSPAQRGRVREGATGQGAREGARVTVAGLVLVRQRPGSASGVIFMTIEDETGIANIVVWPKLFERQRPEVIGARLVAVTGRVQNESGVVHVIAQKIEDLTADLRLLEQSRGANASEAKAREAIPKGRNFQ
ncbi:DnaE-like error-prone DNA polymerase [Methylosinus sp. sav-2]|uniref:DNA polymerase III subunit alpha n=2 Tax=unclassified Methylosinus TaxID=2624500 RepID=UPI001064CF7D|nr:DNA polymerase III subunit alpha [Methylosinus sp. sav-2]TDX65288.1 DnaE-like error-prone DNA polymerase [Methylosinus sp. sav-2]